MYIVLLLKTMTVIVRQKLKYMPLFTIFNGIKPTGVLLNIF